ncbi:SMI1/KNR4 family protein [Pasteurella multocida]|uniref:SMI1/KNR4 family protein n=1 Tax=Pasteurella multocida TaxID=747 RepID=UPI00202212F8|nr:EndoU domain-containing protein [Pasteurella multocida]
MIVDKVIKEYPNGVYEARVLIPNPKAQTDPTAPKFLEKMGNKGVSTMFPRTWTEDRLKVELEYEYVYSFGSTGEGDFVCFDYRDDPKGNEPKICIVIHDEYDEKTGKRLLFPVAENFEAFLNGLKSFDEMLEKYS